MRSYKGITCLIKYHWNILKVVHRGKMLFDYNEISHYLL